VSWPVTSTAVTGTRRHRCPRGHPEAAQHCEYLRRPRGRMRQAQRTSTSNCCPHRPWHRRPMMGRKQLRHHRPRRQHRHSSSAGCANRPPSHALRAPPPEPGVGRRRRCPARKQPMLHGAELVPRRCTALTWPGLGGRRVMPGVHVCAGVATATWARSARPHLTFQALDLDDRAHRHALGGNGAAAAARASCNPLCSRPGVRLAPGRQLGPARQPLPQVLPPEGFLRRAVRPQ